MRRFSIVAVLLFLFAAAAKADVVRILDDPREAMQARADVIRQAKTRVTLLYFLARAGIDFREYKGPDTLHSKSIIIDGRLAMIGSYNIDPRSHFSTPR